MKKNLGFDAERYASLAGFESDWRDTWWHQDTLELMARRLRLDEVERALDVGCGGGHWGQRLSTLLPKGARGTGVDHEPGFLDAASSIRAPSASSTRSTTSRGPPRRCRSTTTPSIS